MSRRLTAATLIVGFLLTLAPSRPAGAVAMDRAQALQTAMRLKALLGVSEREAVATMLALPEDLQLSAGMANQLVPDWQAIRQRLLRLSVREINRRGPAHLTLQRLNAFAAQIQPMSAPPPALGLFGLVRYQAHVGMLAGQTEVPWPGLPDRMASFTNRLMGHPGNQLADLCRYLRAYYTDLGLPVVEQPFVWQGQTYANVVATIPGDSDETVVLVDHFDVAATGKYPEAALQEAKAYGLSPATIAAIQKTRVAGGPVPGADDNATATAALMEAAHLLKGRHLAKTIQLVHLNGEEFPGDCAGARHFVAQALARGQRISAVIVMDMIGVNRQQDRVFQIAVGSNPASIGLADRALKAAASVAAGYHPVVRTHDSPLAYLYNTDGLVFSLAGYPVILLNEHLNHQRDLERLGYHDEFDRTELIDWPYARAIASVGLATALDVAANSAPRFADVQHSQPALQRPEIRVRHFQIELRDSAFYEAVAKRETTLRRELNDGELQAELVADQARDGKGPVGEESVVNRILHWFPESQFAPIDPGAILAELRYLRRRASLSE